MKRQGHSGVLVVLVGIMLLTLPLRGRAQFTFTTNDDHTITITGYTGTNDNVVIPSSTNGYPVSVIGSWALANSANLTSVVIPEGVLIIGDDAFNGCTSLTTVTMP